MSDDGFTGLVEHLFHKGRCIRCGCSKLAIECFHWNCAQRHSTYSNSLSAAELLDLWADAIRSITALIAVTRERHPGALATHQLSVAELGLATAFKHLETVLQKELQTESADKASTNAVTLRSTGPGAFTDHDDEDWDDEDWDDEDWDDEDWDDEDWDDEDRDDEDRDDLRNDDRDGDGQEDQQASTAKPPGPDKGARPVSSPIAVPWSPAQIAYARARDIPERTCTRCLVPQPIDEFRDESGWCWECSAGA